MGRRRDEKVGRQTSLSFAQIQIKAALFGPLFFVVGIVRVLVFVVLRKVMIAAL
jgi:hypothetical protein